MADAGAAGHRRARRLPRQAAAQALRRPAPSTRRRRRHRRAPRFLFLDEPTAGFDPEARRDFQDLIGRLADEGATILVTTHDLDEAEKISDRILILADGRIVADGSPDRLRSRIGSTTEITWTDEVGRHVHAAADPAEFLRAHLADPAARMDDLEVRRSTLEDVYLSLVRRVEQGEESETPELSAARLGAGSGLEEER